MLGGGAVKQLYELKGEGRSIRGIAKELGVSRNSVRKYLRSTEVPKAKPRPKKGSKVDPYKEYLHQRMEEGLDNCVVLLRELKVRGYTGGYTILKDYVQPFRLRHPPQATMRFETEPGEQAQVDWGSFCYLTPEGRRRSVWAFVMVLGWSRAIYLELVRRANLASFIQCHVNAFEHLGGVARRCLYDNGKTVVLGRDKDGRPCWNTKFLDFALLVGFDLRACRPYRAQTKGKVESGIKYVRGNFWPTARFADLEDLNRQAQLWFDLVADQRIHGTTHERPRDRLLQERLQLQPVPEPSRLAPFLREERKVGRDGYVRWQQASYGVPWSWLGQQVQVQARDGVVEVWGGDQRLAVHPQAQRAGQHLTLPGQWAGLAKGDGRPRKEALAVQVATVEVQRRPLESYEALVAGGVP
jgi:transposase